MTTEEKIRRLVAGEHLAFGDTILHPADVVALLDERDATIARLRELASVATSCSGPEDDPAFEINQLIYNYEQAKAEVARLEGVVCGLREKLESIRSVTVGISSDRTDAYGINALLAQFTPCPHAQRVEALTKALEQITKEMNGFKMGAIAVVALEDSRRE